MTLNRRTDAGGKDRARAVVRVKNADTGSWESVVGPWRRSKAQAERDERRLLDRRDAGTLASARGRTVEQYLSGEWLAGVTNVSSRGRALAPTTRARYEQSIAKVAPIIGGVRLVDLRPAHVERLRDELLVRGTLAPQTVADILRVLSQALAAAAARGLIARNPADAALVRRPVGSPRAFPIITPEFGRQILAAARGTDPWDAAAHLALGLSLRREEVLALTWDMVDLAESTVRIERTLTYADGKLHWGPPKSDAGRRELHAPSFVVEALRRHRAAQSKRRLIAGKAWGVEADGVGDLVVDRGLGEPWLPPSFSTYWSRFAQSQGFVVPFHGLRHGTATLLLAAGVPDAVVVTIMGHADVRILRRYQEVVPDLMRDAGRRLEALLASSD